MHLTTVRLTGVHLTAVNTQLLSYWSHCTLLYYTAQFAVQFTTVHIFTVHRAIKTDCIQLTEPNKKYDVQLFGYELINQSINQLITWTICRDAVASKN